MVKEGQEGLVQVEERCDSSFDKGCTGGGNGQVLKKHLMKRLTLSGQQRVTNGLVLVK